MGAEPSCATQHSLHPTQPGAGPSCQHASKATRLGTEVSLTLPGQPAGPQSPALVQQRGRWMGPGEGGGGRRLCKQQGVGPMDIPGSAPCSLRPSSPQLPSCLISSPHSHRQPAGAGGQGQTKASLLTVPLHPGRGFSSPPLLFFSSPSPPSLGRGHGLISAWARWEQMAARRLAWPALPPPLPAEQMPDKGED